MLESGLQDDKDQCLMSYVNDEYPDYFSCIIYSKDASNLDIRVVA